MSNKIHSFWIMSAISISSFPLVISNMDIEIGVKLRKRIVYRFITIEARAEQWRLLCTNQWKLYKLLVRKFTFWRLPPFTSIAGKQWLYNHFRRHLQLVLNCYINVIPIPNLLLNLQTNFHEFSFVILTIWQYWLALSTKSNNYNAYFLVSALTQSYQHRPSKSTNRSINPAIVASND